jgi:hypothetical protein
VAVVGPCVWPSWTAAGPLVAAGPLLFAPAAVLIALAAQGVRAGLLGLVLLAAADIGCYGLSYSVYPHVAPLEEVAGVLQPPAAGRVALDLASPHEPGLRVGNQMLLAGASRVDGYAGLEPLRRLDYRQLSTLRAAGVHWVLRTSESSAIAGLVAHDGDWLAVPDPLPRAWLVTRVIESSHPERALAALPLESAAVAEQVIELPPGPAGTAGVVEDRPGRIEIEVECLTRQFLIVSESFHAGWQAEIDGQAMTPVRADGDFLGCTVPAGRHAVHFMFRPQSLRLGALLSCCGLGLLLLAQVMFARGRSRRSR